MGFCLVVWFKNPFLQLEKILSKRVERKKRKIEKKKGNPK
jgi:hypothetical protein